MDGPFTGVNYTGEIKGLPDTKLEVGKKYVLEVYNDIDERAPIIVLRDNKGQLMWAKLIVVSNVKGFELYKVTELELKSVETPYYYSGYLVRGIVLWSFGRETASFYLDNKGNLINFYLSW